MQSHHVPAAPRTPIPQHLSLKGFRCPEHSKATTGSLFWTAKTWEWTNRQHSPQKCQRYRGNGMEMQIFAKFFMLPLSMDSVSGTRSISEVFPYSIFIHFIHTWLCHVSTLQLHFSELLKTFVHLEHKAATPSLDTQVWQCHLKQKYVLVILQQLYQKS